MVELLDISKLLLQSLDLDNSMILANVVMEKFSQLGLPVIEVESIQKDQLIPNKIYYPTPEYLKVITRIL